MIREGLLRIALRRSEGTEDTIRTRDLVEFGRRAFPLAMQATILSAIGESEFRLYESPHDIAVSGRVPSGSGALPQVTIRDARLTKLGPPYLLVRYLFPADDTHIFLGVFLYEKPGSLPQIDVDYHVQHAISTIVVNVFTPGGFTWGRKGEGPEWDAFQRARIPSRYKSRVLFFKAYDTRMLPAEGLLRADLLSVARLLQWVAFGDTHVGGRVPGMAFASPPQALTQPMRSELGKKPPRLYTVWFGTNRAPRFTDGSLSQFSPFGNERSNAISYGTCTVLIPEAHKFGSMGSAWWKRLLRGRDDRLSITGVTLITSEAEFAAMFRGNLLELDPDARHVLVYIHGYNVSFTEAAKRAAQLGADLNMPVSAFFSWPSKGELTEYLSDEATIEASEPYLASFLTSVAAAAKADRINIIAHSMGNRGLLRVAHRLANLSLPEGVRFGQIVLAAPDVDVQVFCDLATIYPSLSQRTTLYISAKDKALEASNWVHDYQRAGYCPPRTVVSGVDTVEVTNVDLTQLGHGYVGEAEAVLYDMFTLISSNTAPERRARLTEARTASAARYWTIGA